MSVLERIVADKRREIEHRKQRLPPPDLARLCQAAPAARDFAGALVAAAADPPRIIAEVKRASPSKGVLRPKRAWDPEALARAYEEAGAAAVSVLTDGPYFWGSADTLVACRSAVSLPVLRKDFILEPYQVDESRWLGADAVLLLARLHDAASAAQCAARARALGMAVLLEVHADDELELALAVEDVIIGINHRDLDSMQMDMDRAARLRPRIPADRTVVAESGLGDAAALARLRASGIHAFLIGESLAGADDPRARLAELGATS